MPILPIPVDRLLVPERTPAAPDGWTRVRQSLERGLPATFRLDAELSLALYLPSGDALLWRDARGDEPVASSDDDAAPRPAAAPAAPAAPDDPAARAPLRLVLLRGGRVVASMPLVPASPRRLPDDGGAQGALVDLVVLAYQVNAGNLRQAGDYGSFLDFAWRRVDVGSDRFSLPPLDARVAERFSGTIQSQVGEPDGGAP